MHRLGGALMVLLLCHPVAAHAGRGDFNGDGYTDLTRFRVD
jgi:hypothetical protein